ncbi:protein of unknown function [Streptomyces murinus]
MCGSSTRRTDGGRRAPGSVCRRTPSCRCSPGASSPSRARTYWSTRSPRCCADHPGCAGGCSCPSSAVRAEPGRGRRASCRNCARLGLLDVVRCRPATPQRELADWYRDGVTGILVRGHDPDDYARVLHRFAEHPAHAAGMGRAAADHARRNGLAVDGPGHTGQLHPCVAGAGVRGGAGAAARPCPGGRFLPEVQKGRGTSLAFYLSGPKVLAHPKRMSGLISSIGRIKLLVAIPFSTTRPGAVISAPWQVHDLRKHGLRVQRGRL